jgi:cholesterol transport system auxiliary component
MKMARAPGNESFNELKSIAMKNIAARGRIAWAVAGIYMLMGAFALAGCSALPDKPMRPTLYDFGPGPLAASSAAAPPLAPIALGDVGTAGGAIDDEAVLYRLGYGDAQELRPYSLARWTMRPAQLVRQRLREQLGQRRAIFNARESLALNRAQGGALPLQLRFDLEEFTHFFSSPDASVGLLRLRGTLVEVTTTGERLVGQRLFVVQRPANSADAPGGVRALAGATDAVIGEIEQWLQQQAPAR